ncbi:MAG: amphi-Trp domain-containing protein [bacterium]
MKKNKEVEKKYSKKQLVKIIERLAHSMSKNEEFRMQIKGKKVYIPAKSSDIEIEYEKEKKEEKIEIEIKWKKG